MLAAPSLAAMVLRSSMQPLSIALQCKASTCINNGRAALRCRQLRVCGSQMPQLCSLMTQRLRLMRLRTSLQVGLWFPPTAKYLCWLHCKGALWRADPATVHHGRPEGTACLMCLTMLLLCLGSLCQSQAWPGSPGLRHCFLLQGAGASPAHCKLATILSLHFCTTA